MALLIDRPVSFSRPPSEAGAITISTLLFFLFLYYVQLAATRYIISF